MSINKLKPEVFYMVALTDVTKHAGNYVTGEALIALISGTGTSIFGETRNRTDSKSDKTPRCDLTHEFRRTARLDPAYRK